MALVQIALGRSTAPAPRRDQGPKEKVSSIGGKVQGIRFRAERIDHSAGSNTV